MKALSRMQDLLRSGGHPVSYSSFNICMHTRTDIVGPAGQAMTYIVTSGKDWLMRTDTLDSTSVVLYCERDLS